jgi:hypothetical protein
MGFSVLSLNCGHADNMGEDCPVFDNLFEFCQIYAGGTIGQSKMLFPLAHILRKMFFSLYESCL